MNKTIELLKKGFESSSTKTPEFVQFYQTFKKEFTEELKAIGATNIKFKIGHFVISGLFKLNGNVWVFTTNDVRGSEFRLPELLYRQVNDENDHIGGANHFIQYYAGMAKDMEVF